MRYGEEREAAKRDALRRTTTPRGVYALQQPRRGLTLVELLVVIVILTTLVAAAIPIMAPSSETRRLREAARSLQTAITSAQTKATELGRPYGIWLEKQSIQTERLEDRGAVLAVHFCQEPLPFSGFSSASSVILTPRTTNSYVVATNSGTRNRVIAAFGQHFNGQFVVERLPPLMFRPGDRLVVGSGVFEFLHPDISANRWDATQEFLASAERYELAYAGVIMPLYPGYAVSSTGDPIWTYPQKYTIRRQPQKVGDPLQLPAGAAIDLEASGERAGFYHDPLRDGTYGEAISNDTPVVILFSPGGAVHSVIRNVGGDGTTAGLPNPQIVSVQPDGAIHLMVARRELVGESHLDASKTSWLDPESLWVSIAPQTGRVVTEQNMAAGETVGTVDASNWSWQEFRDQRLAAREFARRSQGMGGR